LKLFVLDCSVTMAWCFRDEHTENSAQILHKLSQSKALVPSIWSLEVQNVLNVAERNNRISAANADQFCKLLSSLPIEIDMGFNRLLNDQITALIRTHELSAYNAAYLELALRFKIPLASYDSKLRAAATLAGVSNVI
jgi:predicted nucleic acid-binding protein